MSLVKMVPGTIFHWHRFPWHRFPVELIEDWQARARVANRRASYPAKGFFTVNRPSSTCPCCMSSE